MGTPLDQVFAAFAAKEAAQLTCREKKQRWRVVLADAPPEPLRNSAAGEKSSPVAADRL
jgi:hypothetical protein